MKQEHSQSVFADDRSTARHCFRDVPEKQAIAQARRLIAARQYLADRNLHATTPGNKLAYVRGPTVL